jgi:NADH:ubiquinone oxidoreductase subunit
MSLGTRLFTYLHGTKVGQDTVGNRYYTERGRKPGHQRQRRWVMFAGAEEATAIPPEWHAWLHYTTDAPLAETNRKPWQKPHLPNLTGTAASYRPPGHDYEGGNRAAATGDYESWTPGS